MGPARQAPPARNAPGGPERPADPLDVIEVATAVLARNLELLRRRGAFHSHLDRAEYLLLRTLAATGPADICTLGAGLGLDPSTVGRQVAVMAGKGLVERSPDENDRRRIIISPTPDGLERMNTERAVRRAASAELLAGWSADDLHALGEMFTRYNRAVAERYLSGGRREPAPDPLAATDALLPPAAR